MKSWFEAGEADRALRSLRYYLFLGLLGLVMALTVATFQHAPGYMDADYYYVTGLRLADGSGATEPFLWNYLDDPQGLPHPTFTYWMPLASILASLGVKISGVANFYGARLGSILLAASLPPITAALASRFSSRREASLLAGMLAAFSGFYLVYLTTTDTFGICMVLGATWLLVEGWGTAPGVVLRDRIDLPAWKPLALGIIAGLMHLARADGLIWLGIGVIAVYLGEIKKNAGDSKRIGWRMRIVVPWIGLLLAGYLLVIGPWLFRNLALFGSWMPPGGGRAVWITDYDELYAFPGEILTLSRWSQIGWLEHLQVRLWAMSQNLQNVLGVQGLILLMPLISLGFWQFRNDRRLQLAGLAWVVTFISMSLVFPYQGARGGWFHSGAAFQPLWWALVPIGLETVTAWGERRRGWNEGQAGRILGGGLILLAAGLTALIAIPRLIGSQAMPGWGDAEARYARLDQALDDLGIGPEAIILVNNPPGFYAATGRPSIAIPDGDINTSLAAANRFQADYLVLEANHPDGLEAIYRLPVNNEALRFLGSFEGAHVFEVLLDEGG